MYEYSLQLTSYLHVHVMNHESLANCEFASLLLPVFYVYIMQLHIIHVNFIHIHYVYSRIFMMYNLHVQMCMACRSMLQPR